jgi:predicted Zn-dependent peptidase
VIHVVSKTHSRLATIIISFNAGSRVEELSGYSPGTAHMLEHSIFKGTVDRTSTEIQREIAFLGGHSNAFTSHESVAYYITVPFENLEKCVEILADMVFNPIFPEEEILKEIEVVKEEEASSLDDVGSFIWRGFSENFFDNYLASPVLGTSESISGFSRDEIKRFHSEFCNRKDAVVSVCSNLSKSKMKEMLIKYFGKQTGKIGKAKEFSDTSYDKSRVLEAERAGIEHTYVWMGTPGFNAPSEHIYAAQLMTTVLGRGMDSRLFSEVREKRGLVYSVSASYNDWQHGAVSMINFSTRSLNVEEALDVVHGETERIKVDLITDEELQRAKNKMRSSFYSAIEDNYSIAYWGIKERLFNSPSIEEYISNIDKVTREDVRNVSNILFDNDKRLVMICGGAFDEA